MACNLLLLYTRTYPDTKRSDCAGLRVKIALEQPPLRSSEGRGTSLSNYDPQKRTVGRFEHLSDETIYLYLVPATLVCIYVGRDEHMQRHLVLSTVVYIRYDMYELCIAG